VKIPALSAEVHAALEAGKPVVALESTIISHGFPEAKTFKPRVRGKTRFAKPGQPRRP